MLPNISVLWFVDCDDPIGVLRGGAFLEPAATTAFIEKAFADTEITAIGTSDLAAAVGGSDNRIFAAHFGSLAVLAGHSLRTATPDELTSYLTDLGVGHFWTLVSVDPDADTGCFARWDDGELHRAFAGTSTSITVDAGLPHPFEGPFWAGEHPQSAAADDPLALPFHPGALADAAHREWFGFGFRESEPTVDPASIPVTVYRVGPDDGRDQFIESSVSLADGPTAHPAVEATEPITKVTVPATPLDAQTDEHQIDESGINESGINESGIDDSGADDSGADGPVNAPHRRTPGPLSRYFGFRGRL